jgi:3',5'-cyclic AMP phosphodiesterase CpdA
LPVEAALDPKLHETVYTVDYQDVRIVVLNSNTNLEEQSAYIEAQLKDSDAKWKILSCHHSIFSPAKGRDFQFAREEWKPLLDAYGVDLVLNGHDHTYARGHVPSVDKDGTKDDLGAVYVTSVSGPKQYELDAEQMKAYKAQDYELDKAAEQTQFYQVIHIEDNQLSYVAYTALGEEYDRAVIQKDFSTGKKRLIEGD